MTRIKLDFSEVFTEDKRFREGIKVVCDWTGKTSNNRPYAFIDGKWEFDASHQHWYDDFKSGKISGDINFQAYRNGVLVPIIGVKPTIKRKLKGRLIELTRLVLLTEAEYKCPKCGYSRLNGSGTPNLDIDHIDGNRTNGYISNLQVLCKNCHGEITKHSGNSKKYDKSGWGDIYDYFHKPNLFSAIIEKGEK